MVAEIEVYKSPIRPLEVYGLLNAEYSAVVLGLPDGQYGRNYVCFSEKLRHHSGTEARIE